MNKKTFNTVFLFTGFVVLGIMALQMMWLYNMSGIRKTELKTNTQQALSQMAIKLEKNENLTMIMENYRGFMPENLPLPPLNPELKLLANLNDTNLEQGVINKTLKELNKASAELRKNRYLELEGITQNYYNVITQNQALKVIDDQLNGLEDWSKKIKQDVMESDSLGNLTNMEIVDVDNNRKIVINSTINSRIHEKTMDIDTLVHQMIFELDDKPVSERLPLDSISVVLARELKKKGIDINFEYAVMMGDSVISASPQYIPSSMAMTFETKLFPDDIFDKNLKLVVYYPLSASNGYVFSKMKTLLILTAIFTLGILIAFYLTMRTMNRQKKLGEMKNDFINNITHEFKTPIATSSIAIAALENDQVRVDAQKFNYYTGILKEENTKMNQQVEKVLQIALMENSKMEVTATELDVHLLLKQAVKNFELIFAENRVELAMELKAERYKVYADGFHLLHVFNNIIDNAVKYRNETCKLTIRTQTQTNQLVIRLIDNGPGMSDEIKKNAFEKFYRGQKGNLHEVKGFGLGLSYAKSIVELAKGTIQLISSPNQGTEVVISLPLI
jgi:two-component system phosphate regulon sensor histidine kinase PhoR